MMTFLDFDLKALYEALDEKRRSRGMRWAAVAREINHSKTVGMAPSTIMGIKDRPQCEGDGILQMLLWLRRTPESFVPGFEDAGAEHFRLPEPRSEQTLRWDARALYAALDALRQARGMTWMGVAKEVGGVTPGMLTRLAKGGRTSFPVVMRMVRWLGQPAVTFTRASDW